MGNFEGPHSIVLSNSLKNCKDRKKPSEVGDLLL